MPRPRHPSKEGIDVAEMRRRIRVIDVIEKDGELLEFEDSDYDCVKRCVESMRWASIHKEIIEFVDYICSHNQK
jgi:hypothetical protein